MALRQLSTEERAEARAKALRARQERAEVKSAFAAGEVSLAEVLDRADRDPAIGRLRTADLLQALPGVGAVAPVLGTVGRGVCHAHSVRSISSSAATMGRSAGIHGSPRICAGSARGSHRTSRWSPLGNTGVPGPACTS